MHKTLQQQLAQYSKFNQVEGHQDLSCSIFWFEYEGSCKGRRHEKTYKRYYKIDESILSIIVV